MATDVNNKLYSTSQLIILTRGTQSVSNEDNTGHFNKSNPMTTEKITTENRNQQQQRHDITQEMTTR